MTPQIQRWFQHTVRNIITQPGHVLEVGALDVNGTVRQFFPDADRYIGTDMQAGPNVNLVCNNDELPHMFGPDPQWDTIIACEVFEHDIKYWEAVTYLRRVLKPDGFLVITTPTFGFPEHRYPRDYWRFGEDAYREVFFKNMTICDLRHLDNAAGPRITLAGIAQKG